MKNNHLISGPELISGVMIKDLVRHFDDRGFFEELIRKNDPFFAEGFGQLSHSYMKKDVVKAWHVHVKQVDWWFVAKGVLLVALYDTRKDSPTRGLTNTFRMGEGKSNIVLKIPPGVAHGCRVLTDESELFYVTSGMYDTKEEGRIPHDDPEIGFDWIKPQD